METPFYEIVTMCPYGMAPELQSYLNNTVEVDDKIIQMKGLIANVILEPYYESELPFACTLLGWASLDKEQELQMMVQSIMESLKCYRSEELVSVEGFGHSLDKGVIQIHGVYPLLDLNDKKRTMEYGKVSFIMNKERTDNIFSWSYSSFFEDALIHNDLGLLFAILAETTDIARQKMSEVVKIITKENM